MDGLYGWGLLHFAVREDQRFGKETRRDELKISPSPHAGSCVCHLLLANTIYDSAQCHQSASDQESPSIGYLDIDCGDNMSNRSVTNGISLGNGPSSDQEKFS